MRASAFYDFINEREQVRLRKEADLPYPWTEDPILSKYKFTNVRREHDKTSRLLREEFYTPHFWAPREELLMNAALFRYFGTIEFARAVGWQTYEDFDFEGIKAVATERLANGERTFTGAYIITNQGISAPKQNVVVDHFLSDLHMSIPKAMQILRDTNSWEQVGRFMMTVKGFGGSGFMTKEVLLDTTYTSFWAHPMEASHQSFPIDWYNWTPIGPGARRGAARVLGDDSAKPLSEQKAFELIFELLHAYDYRWLHEGSLCPHDIQFQLCEFDKYERVRLGQGKPRSLYRV